MLNTPRRLAVITRMCLTVLYRYPRLKIVLPDTSRLVFIVKEKSSSLRYIFKAIWKDTAHKAKTICVLTAIDKYADKYNNT